MDTHARAQYLAIIYDDREDSSSNSARMSNTKSQSDSGGLRSGDDRGDRMQTGDGRMRSGEVAMIECKVATVGYELTTKGCKMAKWRW